jgi:hypothetical protein
MRAKMFKIVMICNDIVFVQHSTDFAEKRRAHDSWARLTKNDTPETSAPQPLSHFQNNQKSPCEQIKKGKQIQKGISTLDASVTGVISHIGNQNQT